MVLTYGILCQTKTPGVICANDAKSCYDLIVHSTVALAMRRQGVPEGVATCLFNTLQEAIHQVHTAYGDSEFTFGGEDIIPLHGVCQGNGAGPPLWVVVSTIMLNMLWVMNVGSFIKNVISLRPIRYSGFSFVDEMDTIQTVHNREECWQDGEDKEPPLERTGIFVELMCLYC